MWHIKGIREDKTDENGNGEEEHGAKLKFILKERCGMCGSAKSVAGSK